jgi:hypothetical protein
VSILLKKLPVFLQLNIVHSGLFSFASTTMILSLYNLQTRGIHTPNVVVGMAVFCGGLAQLLAGMWEFPRNNAFGGLGELLSTDNSLMSLHIASLVAISQPFEIPS